MIQEKCIEYLVGVFFTVADAFSVIWCCLNALIEHGELFAFVKHLYGMVCTSEAYAAVAWASGESASCGIQVIKSRNNLGEGVFYVFQRQLSTSQSLAALVNANENEERGF